MRIKLSELKRMIREESLKEQRSGLTVGEADDRLNEIEQTIKRIRKSFKQVDDHASIHLSIAKRIGKIWDTLPELQEIGTEPEDFLDEKEFVMGSNQPKDERGIGDISDREDLENWKRRDG
jgi:hypothetical protein